MKFSTTQQTSGLIVAIGICFPAAGLGNLVTTPDPQLVRRPCQAHLDATGLAP